MKKRHFYIVSLILIFTFIFTGVKIIKADVLTSISVVENAPIESSAKTEFEGDVAAERNKLSTVAIKTEPTTTYLDYEAGIYTYSYACSNGINIKYVIKIPKNMTADMPLILWLHGQGDIGITLPENYGAIKAANELNEERFVIVQPCATYGWYVKEQTVIVMELMDTIIEEYSLNSNRVILTGHSLGGLGAWYYGEHYTDRWAAVVPVSNKPTVRFDNLLNSNVPVWAFWSNWDVESNIFGMSNAVKQLEEARPHSDIRGTEIQNISHNGMSCAPYTQDFFDWAVEQTRE